MGTPYGAQSVAKGALLKGRGDKGLGMNFCDLLARAHKLPQLAVL
jgi:hypothetical protein